MLGDEIHRPPGPEIGEMLTHIGDVVLPAVVEDGRVAEAGGVAAAEGDPEIEAQRGTLMGAEVVFAHQRGAVTGIGQGLGPVAKLRDG